MSIKEKVQKIKSYKHFGILSLLLVCVLVGFASFFMGRLSGLREIKTPIILGSYKELTMPAALGVTAEGLKQEAAAESAVTTPDGTVVASKKGKTYSYPWCAGAKRISPENKITFVSAAEAKKAGFAPAQNCKGL